jgi:hypothetical protein
VDLDSWGLRRFGDGCGCCGSEAYGYYLRNLCLGEGPAHSVEFGRNAFYEEDVAFVGGMLGFVWYITERCVVAF